MPNEYSEQYNQTFLHKNVVCKKKANLAFQTVEVSYVCSQHRVLIRIEVQEFVCVCVSICMHVCVWVRETETEMQGVIQVIEM